jgi:GTP-binding protein
MALPQVVIVGRPNVGKSSIFNWLVGRRVAIVDNVAGVTRDRLTHLVHGRGRYFELVDTGGMGIDDIDNLTAHIEDQIQAALDSASVVLFVVDAQAGLTPMDQDVAKRLRYLDVPVICVANKADNDQIAASADEFYKLGRGKLVRVSTVHNRGRDELFGHILSRLPPERPGDQQAAAEPAMKVAIVGRRNTGKSTLVNTLAHAERVIVSEVPGTTRDSVDVRFELDGKVFLAIDTPGLKRKSSIASDIEFYSLNRAQRSIRRADVVLLFFDACESISRVEKQLATFITSNYKPCIFVVNKWDLRIDNMPPDRWVRYLRETFRTMWYVPIAFITAKTGKNVKALLNHAQNLFKQSSRRVETGELNRLVKAALERHPPPEHQGRQGKILYATQVSVQPPTIVLICNDPAAFSHTYRRYLLGVFRDQLNFSEVPIKLYLRRRESQRGPRGVQDQEMEEAELD